MIYDRSRAFLMQRNQRLINSQAHNLVRLILADYGKSEELFIKCNRRLQIAHLNTHMVDSHTLETGFLQSRCRRPARGREHSEPANQFSPSENAFLETRHQICND